MRSEDEERLRRIATGYYLARKMGVTFAVSLEDDGFLLVMWEHEQNNYKAIVAEVEQQMGIRRDEEWK